MESRLALLLLGPPRIEREGQTVKLNRRKAIALVAYLSVTGPSARRDSLVDLLWPEYGTASARSALRRTLFALRKALPGDWLAAEREEIGVRLDGAAVGKDAETVWVDVVAFRRALAACEGHGHPAGSVCPSCVSPLTGAVALARGEFMSGFGLRDSVNFDDWQVLQAEMIRRELDGALQRLVRWHSARREFDLAVRYARRRLALDPLDEGARRQLMRLYAWSGRRSAALGQFEECAAVLADQLGVQPEAETTDLFQSILGGSTPPLPAFDDVLSSAVATLPAAEQAHPATGAATTSTGGLASGLPPFLAAEVEVETPLFVAREEEWARLDGHLQAALAGSGRVVFVTGDAGSGKTALLQELARRALVGYPDPSPDSGRGVVVAGGRGNAQTGIGDPYLPFREILGLLTGDVEAEWAAGVMTREQARRLWHTLPSAAEALVVHGPDLIDTFVQRGALLRRSTAYAPGRAAWLDRLEEGAGVRPDTAPGITSPLQGDLFEQYTRVMHALARQGPLLLIIDDLQWAGLGTISLLFHLGRELAGHRILIVGAYRPEEIALGHDGKRHPLEPVVHELQRLHGEITVDLGKAESRAFVESYLDSEPNRLGDAFREMLYRQTRGHPLFTIELLRGLQDQGDLVQDEHGGWVEGPSLNWDTLPARVEAVIAERVGRLPEPLQEALQVASVEGEVFSAEVVAKVRGGSVVELVGRLSRELDKRHRLVRAQGIQRVGDQRLSQYRFRHILFQKYLYSGLDEVERAYLHEAVGAILEVIYEGRPEALAAAAGQLAWHFDEAGLADKAIHYLYQAGRRAERLCAYEESVAHVTRALEMLRSLPEPVGESERQERAATELGMQLLLGKAWIGLGTFGFAAGKAFARALELTQRVGTAAQISHIVGELSVFQYVSSDPQRARDLASKALGHAESAGDPLLVALANWYLGLAQFALGDYEAARARHAFMTSFYEPEVHHRLLLDLRGSDAGTSAMSYEACSLWCLGFPDQAGELGRHSLALARAQGHIYSLCDVLCFAGCQLHRMMGDARALQVHAHEMRRLARQEGVPGWMAAGLFYGGEALVELGKPRKGIAMIREGLAKNEKIGIRVFSPGVLCTVARAHSALGELNEGLATVEDALSRVEETGERHWASAVHCTRGDLLAKLGEEAAAEASFEKAIEVARDQRAKSWELQATIRLARLWRAQGKGAEARERLSGVYGWFSEGFETPDLIEARALLRSMDH